LGKVQCRAVQREGRNPRRGYRVPHMRLVIEARHQGIEDEVEV
jgi:hypothetical protein